MPRGQLGDRAHRPSISDDVVAAGGSSALFDDLLEAVEHHLPGGSGMLGLLSAAAVVLSQLD